MTDAMAALASLANSQAPRAIPALERFYAEWKHEPLVVDKWLAVQATSRLPGTLARVERLMHHEAFDIRNPNKVYALIRALLREPRALPRRRRLGYAFARRPGARARRPQPADRRAHRARVRPLEEVRRRPPGARPRGAGTHPRRRTACRRTSPRW